MPAYPSSSKVVLITGANQGLGLAVIEVGGLRHPEDTYILCSRNVDKGTLAISKLREAGVKAKIDLVELEVTNDNHIAAAVKHVDTNYARLDGKNSQIPQTSASISQSTS